MISPMDEFLGQLSHEHVPLLATAAGTIQFDVRRGGRTEHRLVTLDHGDVAVRTGQGKADSVVAVDADLFDEIIEGHVNAMAAVLRGAMHVDGNPELLIQLQRVFPGPPRSADWSQGATRPARPGGTARGKSRAPRKTATGRKRATS